MKTSNYLPRFVRFFKLLIPIYLGLVIIVGLVSYLVGRSSIFEIGSALMFSGVGFAILGLVALTRIGGSRGGDHQSPHLRDDNFFRRERAANKPFERVVLTGIVASLCVTASGYLLLYLFGYG
jgi:multisubunit Na+/H+ antiporter MnhC subunit